MRHFFASFIEILEVALIAVGAVFFIRSFLLQPFLVSGYSMAPNFSDGDYLLIDELTYRMREPERGEIIVFRFPKDESTFFIKRIIGLPGEKVTIRDGKIQITSSDNSQSVVLKEGYLPSTLQIHDTTEVVLGEDEYFVMGDNRSFSFDSRSWGALAKKDIIGLVRVRLWPLSGFRAFAAPQY